MKDDDVIGGHRTSGKRTTLAGGRALAALTAALFVGACSAPAPWVNSERTEAEVQEDKQDCRRRAQLSAERDFQSVYETRRSIDDGRVPMVLDSMDRQEARAREQRLFDRCMVSRGYRRADQAPPPPAPPAPPGGSQ